LVLWAILVDLRILMDIPTPHTREVVVRQILLVCLVAILVGCAGTSVCRRASQGDLPCQSLKGAAFDSCQTATQRAHDACQAEQMTSSKDSTGFYSLPK